MHRMVLSASLALITAISGATTIVLAARPAEPSTTLHSSALKKRVAERRARRTLQKREPVTDQSRPPIKRVRRPIARPQPESEAPLSPRLQRLQRREQRRLSRLKNQPASRQMAVVDATNQERRKHGLLPLTYNLLLEQAAQQHALDMQRRNYFAHESPEGTRSGDRIRNVGYGVIDFDNCHCRYQIFLGENIAKGQTSVEQVIREWMASPSHRDAILSPDYKEIGVGLIENIWVQNFGGIEITPLD